MMAEKMSNDCVRKTKELNAIACSANNMRIIETKRSVHLLNCALQKTSVEEDGRGLEREDVNAVRTLHESIENSKDDQKGLGTCVRRI